MLTSLEPGAANVEPKEDSPKGNPMVPAGTLVWEKRRCLFFPALIPNSGAGNLGPPPGERAKILFPLVSAEAQIYIGIVSKKSPQLCLLDSVRDYFTMTAKVWEIEASGDPAAPRDLKDLQENEFYQWNSEAMLAFTHGLEDLALEEASGALLSTFPDAAAFEPQRERYWQLGATLDQVEVLLCGSARRSGRIRFLRASADLPRRYWAIFYTGRRLPFALIGRQLSKAVEFEKRIFRGFFTSNPGIIERLKSEMLNAGRSSPAVLPEFDRLEKIDLAAKNNLRTFARETLALQKQIRKLQLDGAAYPSRSFTANLERSFARLGEWKDQLSLLASQPGAEFRK